MTRPVNVDGNEAFVLSIYCSIIIEGRIKCGTFIQFLYKENQMWKQIHGHWSQVPAKRTNTKPTYWLLTSTKRRLQQTPP
jgi:hypothetical protein